MTLSYIGSTILLLALDVVILLLVDSYFSKDS